MHVLLLQRAFGVDCFQMYYQSGSHKSMKKTASSPSSEGKFDESNQQKSNPLVPLVLDGGTWESSRKVPLQEEHYLPMQPVTRSKRRPTLHGRDQLFCYLVEQSRKEGRWQVELEKMHVNPQLPEKITTVYMDGVFDLFHIGHLEAIKQCALLGNRVIIGVTGDADAVGYKRPPVISEKDRVAVVESLKEVAYVICPCPLIVTEAFLKEHNIDLVVHGFANDADAKRQEEFFAIPMKLGKFKRIGYYQGLSTTDIITKIRNSSELEETNSNIMQVHSPRKPQWFGAALAAATDNAADLPFRPFLHRTVIEPYIRKATTRREQALMAIRQATGELIFSNTISEFLAGLAREGNLSFDTTKFPLRHSLLTSANFDASTDLSQLHRYPGAKNRMLYSLTNNYSNFQQVFDDFVRHVCVPHLTSIYDCEEVYYQSFPCIRIVQPNEFSIGPHADVAYGHHPCSINFYIPLTEIGGTSALFLESELGSEDWHPIVGNYGNLVKHFAGAMCLHWTTENKTSFTRVSLDFRIIPGKMFHCIQCGGAVAGGQLDVYRQTEGYYSRCYKATSQVSQLWIRDGPLVPPDARVGFPWTVKDWSVLLQKQSSDENEKK